LPDEKKRTSMLCMGFFSYEGGFLNSYGQAKRPEFDGALCGSTNVGNIP
jgi:hypothetical protein